MLPLFGAGFGVETRHHLLEVGSFAEETVDVKTAVGDDGGGLPWKIGEPERFFGIDPVRQAGFERGAILVRAAPGEPAADGGMKGAGGGGQEEGNSDSETRESGGG